MVNEFNITKDLSAIIENIVLPSRPSNLYDPLRYFLKLSGKRIRPQLVYYGAEVFGFGEFDEILPAALAIEYFHNFSLIHDDIMDQAELRRGAKTIHKRWNDSVAILSGDVLLVKAYQEIAKCSPDKISKLLDTFNELAVLVCEGQQLDMDFEDQDEVNEAEYIEMIRAKTSVLLGGALKMGAILASASVEDQEHIYQLGVNIGIAFQIQDDYLDAFGDPKAFGKVVGGDILADKKTILWVKLMQRINQEDLSELDRIKALGDANLKIETTLKLYQKYQIPTTVDALKEHFSDLAFASLDKISQPEEQKSPLLTLIRTLMIRSK